MKKLLLLAGMFLVLNAGAQITPAAKGVNYGAATTEENAIDVATLEAKMARKKKFSGKVRGTVISVCEKKGCWMKLAQANGEGMMIKFKDYGFFMPMDIVGKEVVLDGKAKKEVISVEELKHYAEDAGKSKEEIEKITTPSSEISFEAKGVLVVKD